MIKLICVGKIKEKYLTDGVNDYFKRINKYHKFEIIEVDDSIPSIEETKIMKHIDNNFISHSNITFVIGGSYGLSNNIKNRSNYKLSFSNMTFPHGLFRLIFLEQLYRCFKIINNETYHK